MEIKVGAQCTETTIVVPENTAKAVGSGTIEVFSTPMMIALMELAASNCLSQFLEEGQSSVGTSVNITHDAATPLGCAVKATATITAVDRRKVDFNVEAFDDSGKIGGGTHSRFVIDIDRFMEKAAERRQ